MNIRTPVTAFQMTSLHWQRSVSVKRTRNEKLDLRQPAYISAEDHCLCCSIYTASTARNYAPFEKSQISP